MKEVPSKYAVTIVFLLTICIFCEKAAIGNTEGDKQDPNYTAYLNDIVITPSGSEESIFDSFRSITVADTEDIQNRNQLSILDTLDDRIGIWVEKRTTTNSDPVIRGLSGGNLLALVDRNTLTTLWGEGGFAGDDMYGKIDSESIERIEVVRGPSSVLYGSNALGGVINFITKEPPLDYTSSGYKFGGRLKGTYGSAADYQMGRIETWGATTNSRYIMGFSAYDADNTKAGGNAGILDPSGGRNHSFDIKTEFKLEEGRYLDFSSQFMRRPEIYRYYRPTQVNENYRDGVAFGYRDYTLSFADKFEWRGYYQRKKDIRRWLTSDMVGVAEWDTYSSDMQINKSIGQNHELTAGLHYGLDFAESPDDEQFTITTAATGEQKASPDTDWGNMGAFIQNQWSMTPEWKLTGSFRYDYFRFKAANNVFYTIPGSTAPENVAARDPGTFSEEAYTGGLGLLYEINNSWNVVGSWFRGYRLFPPSFGLRQLGYGLLVPNELLDHVTGDTFELSTKIKGEVINTTLTGYYTDFDNFQQPIPGTYNGMTSYDFDGSGTIDSDENIYVNAANGDAYVEGVELECEVKLGSICESMDGWRVFGGFMWNYGKMKFPGSEEEPLRHTHPARGLLKIRYDDTKPEKKWWAELSTDIVRRYDQISDSRLTGDVGFRSDPQDASSPLVRDYGLPGYTVYDLRCGYNFKPNMRMTLAIENIFNKYYRTAHSRMDAQGRNLLLSMEYMF